MYCFVQGEVTLKFSGKPASTKRQERLTEPQPNIEVKNSILYGIEDFIWNQTNSGYLVIIKMIGI